MLDKTQLESMANAARVIGSASDTSQVHERDGITVSVVPSAPTQRLLNMVVPADSAALVSALGWIADVYESAGVRAWRVCDGTDGSAEPKLRSLGYVPGGQEPAMILDLATFAPPHLGAFTWDADGDMTTLGAMNAPAYAHGHGFEDAFRVRPPGLRVYCTASSGAHVSALGAVDNSARDVGIFFLATLPNARRRGYARRLMAAALRDARARGCETSSLQAQPEGTPLYEALGYRTVGYVRDYYAAST